MTWPLAASMSAGARTALLGLLGLLVVILGCLVAFAFVIRRRPAAPERQVAAAVKSERSGASGRAYAVEDPMVCPACRREFSPALRHCPHDAAALVPAPAMLERMHKQARSSTCPRCRRAYEGRVRFCPHDGSDLIPTAVYQASRKRARGQSSDHEPDHDHDRDAGSISAKICPECQGRYAYQATFCGKDGVELVVLN